MNDPVVCRHDSEGLCGLAEITERADTNVLKRILQDARFDGRDDECLSYALQAAALENSLVMAEILIHRGANINFRGGLYDTALQAAVLGGHEQMIEMLLHHGARLHEETDNFGTPLQASAVWGRPGIVSLLVDHGAGVNQFAGKYHSALQIASLEGNPAIVQLLLKRGADVNAYGGVHGSALRAAAHILGIPVRMSPLATSSVLETWLCQNGGRLRACGHAGHVQVIEILLDAIQKDDSQ